MVTKWTAMTKVLYKLFRFDLTIQFGNEWSLVIFPLDHKHRGHIVDDVRLNSFLVYSQQPKRIISS
jgi:hypothetical protein